MLQVFSKVELLLERIVAKCIDRRIDWGLPSDTLMPRARANTDTLIPPNRRRTFGRIFALALLAVLAAFAVGASPIPAQAGGMPRAQKHESRHEIDQMEELWRDAVLKGDTAKMASLLADDYMAISPSGTLQNKEQSLASLSSGRMHFSSLELSDRKVRFYGTTALVTSLAMVVGNTPEGDLVGSFRYTRVYVRDAKGTWKVVSFEASRVRPAGQHRPR